MVEPVSLTALGISVCVAVIELAKAIKQFTKSSCIVQIENNEEMRQK